MENNPLVSVLMNCYNCEKYLKEALDSIYAQTYQNFEIIFIDNCSTDKSAEIVKQYDKRLKYYKTPQHVSLCNARVFAKQYISGDFFCVLDTDDLWMPEKLEKQIEVMNKYNDVGIVYSNTIYFTDEGKKTLAYDKLMPSGNIFEELLENYFFSFETVMVRKSVMDKNKIYFDPKYNVSSDAEFFIKLSYFTKCFYINEPLAKWRYGHFSESDKHINSFPIEYEMLLKDLSQIIKDFEKTYKNSIKRLKAKINYMKGLYNWKTGNKKNARKLFLKAYNYDKKYIFPLLLSLLFSYETYIELRRYFKKI